ncbi:MAG: hypothetical protein AB1531_12265 [Chloroflexota bacterium]
MSDGFDELVEHKDGNGIIILWDLANGQEVARLYNDGYFIHCLDFSPDGKTLAACANDIGGTNDIALWDVAQHETVGHLETPNWSNGGVYALSFSPDGKLLAGAALVGPVVWDVEMQTPLGATQSIETNSEIDFSPEGRWLVFTNTQLYTFTMLTL